MPGLEEPILGASLNRTSASNSTLKENGYEINANINKYCLLPRALGRRILLQQVNRSPAGRGVRVHCGAVRPQLNGRGRRLNESSDRSGQQPGYPCRTLLWRKRHHRRRNRRSRCRPGLHLRTCSGRGRDLADAAVQFPEDSGLLAHRRQGRTHLVASGRRRRFRRRFARAREKARFSDAGRSETRPVRRKSRGNRLEIKAQLVHRREKRPHGSPRSGARHGQAHGRHNL